MSGKHAGLQAILRENYMPRGIYIHCSTHRLNLVIVDTCKGVPYVDEFFSIMSKLHDYFSSSGVTNEYFRDAQQLLNIGMYVLHLISVRHQILYQLATKTRLKPWGNTRWDSRWSSIDAIRKNFGALTRALQQLVDEQSRRSIDARGLLQSMRTSSFVVTTFAMFAVLGPIKILSDQLKGNYKNALTTHRSISLFQVLTSITEPLSI